MGQADSRQIQQCALKLQQQQIISHKQYEKFIKDYHNHEEITQDVRNFNDNQLKIFLKYFLLFNYSSQQHKYKQKKDKNKNRMSFPSINTVENINYDTSSVNILQQQDTSQYNRNQRQMKGSNNIMKVMRVNSNNLNNIQPKKFKNIQNQIQSIIYSNNFNVLQYETKSKQLRDIVIKMFQQTQYVKNNQFVQKSITHNSSKLKLFLAKLQSGYQQKNNKFHNYLHGVNVMHSTFLMVNKDNNNKQNLQQKPIRRIDQFLSQFSKFTLIFSGLCHDVGHKGFSNAFQITTQSKIALRYNDISPLQNYHIQRTLQLLKSEQTNFLDFLTKQQTVKFRKYVISNILFTDIKEHFGLLKKFQQQYKPNTKSINFEAQKILCGMIIHSSDFAGSIKQYQISQQWSRRVNIQFKNQSLKQKQLNIPQTPFLLNLDNPLILAKNQLGFLKLFVQPLYKSLSQFQVNNMKIQQMFKQVNQNVYRQQQILKIIQAQQDKNKN